MLPFKKILCPTDFSEPSYTALRAAKELALIFGAELILLHVIQPLPPYPDPGATQALDLVQYMKEMTASSDKMLREVAGDNVGGKIPVRMLTSSGNPAEEITRVGADEHVDLVVIATHGLTGWRHLVFGSVAEKVVRHSVSPVLTIPILQDETRHFSN
jgi:universal stress protein A